MKSSHETKNHHPCKSSEGHRHVFATHDITLIAMATVFALRLAAIVWGLHLPTFDVKTGRPS